MFTSGTAVENSCILFIYYIYDFVLLTSPNFLRALLFRITVYQIIHTKTLSKLTE
jgi:hypothetical protein